MSEALRIGGTASWIRPLPARRDDAVETDPQRSLAAAESELDRLPAQRLGLAVEERFGGERCFIARAGTAPRRITRPPLLKRPSRPPRWLFLQRIYSHTHLLCVRVGIKRSLFGTPMSN
jgi:hypothetical protein